jgi:DnaK suppressor protein
VGQLDADGGLIFNADQHQATARRAELELQRIRTALGRLQSGDYGYCVKCEEEIAEGRLRVDPASLVCIDCAKAAEGK